PTTPTDPRAKAEQPPRGPSTRPTRRNPARVPARRLSRPDDLSAPTLLSRHLAGGLPNRTSGSGRRLGETERRQRRHRAPRRPHNLTASLVDGASTLHILDASRTWPSLRRLQP